MVNIAIVGLGQMGTSIKERLEPFYKIHSYDKKYSVELDNIYKNKKNEAQESLIAILCLPNSQEVSQVLSFLIKNSQIKYIIDHTTNFPNEVNNFYSLCNNKGVHYIEAPMIGGVRSVRKGNLTILTIDNIDDYKELKNVFSCYVKKIICAGKVTVPSQLKLLHNMVTIGNTNIFLEVLAFSKALKIDISKFFDVIQSGTASSYVSYNTLVRTILDNNFEDGFKLYLACKDIKYSKQLANKAKLKLPLFSVIENNMDIALEKENFCELDYPIIYKVIEKLVGINK